MAEPIYVGINGFGRVGVLTFKELQPAIEEGIVDVVLINDPFATPEQMAQYLKYDSVHRDSNLEDVGHEDNKIIVNDKGIEVMQEKDPRNLPWKDKGVRVVYEATGVFRKAGNSEEPGYMDHIEGGADFMLLSAPAKDDLAKVTVLGVNFNKEDLEKYQAWSNASCTTNCLAPLVKVLYDNFGIVAGDMITIHADTNDQNTLDGYHKDPRRRRAAFLSIIPTTTGASKAMGIIFPELKDKISATSAISYRVPVPDGSIVDFLVKLEKDASPEKVNKAFKEASETYLKGILEYTEDPLVSVDIIGNPHSAIVDGLLTTIGSDGKIKVLGWYDNERGYSRRSAELLTYMARHLLRD